MTYLLLTALYGILTAATFGYFLSHGRPEISRRALQAVAAIAWPVYWPAFHGIEASIAMVKPTVENVYVFVTLMFPAFYLFHYWDGCEGFRACITVFLKAVLWAPFWPAYMVASAM